MSTIPYGRVNVPTSAGQLTANTTGSIRSIGIFAEAANVGVTYIGGDSSVASTNGFPLNPGDTITIDAIDTSGIWMIGTSGDKVRYIGAANP